MARSWTVNQRATYFYNFLCGLSQQLRVSEPRPSRARLLI
jgi:hypothetical protein